MQCEDKLKIRSPIFRVSTCVLGQPISWSSMTVPRRNLLRYASHAVSTQVRVILEIPRIHVVSARTSGTATVSRAADGNGMLGTDRVPVYRRFRWHFHSFVFQGKTFFADFENRRKRKILVLNISPMIRITLKLCKSFPISRQVCY